MIRIRNTGFNDTERKGAQISKQNVGENKKVINALVTVSQPVSGTIRVSYFTQKL
jgi:hypothetical protein